MTTNGQQKTCTAARHPCGSTAAARMGFTFIEVLFAVIILGIGFIMIAGIFPVALKQTASNAEDTMAAATFQAASNYLNGLPLGGNDLSTSAPILPATGTGAPAPKLAPFRPLLVWSSWTSAMPAPTAAQSNLLWDRVRGGMINTNDPRYAWVAFYQREQNSAGVPADTAQVLVMVLKSRAKSQYDATDITGVPSHLEPVIVANITLNPANSGAPYTDLYQTIVFNNGTPQVAAEGAYVLISDGATNWAFNGQYFKLGAQLDATTWVLDPAITVNGAGSISIPVALMMGRGVDGSGAFAGPAQDVGVTRISVRLR